MELAGNDEDVQCMRVGMAADAWWRQMQVVQLIYLNSGASVLEPVYEHSYYLCLTIIRVMPGLANRLKERCASKVFHHGRGGLIQV